MNVLILTSVLLIFSIIIFWETTVLALRKRKIKMFLPFFVIGVLMCFNGAFTFYKLYVHYLWGLIELGQLVVFVWVLVNIRREKWD